MSHSMDDAGCNATDGDFLGLSPAPSHRHLVHGVCSLAVRCIMSVPVMLLLLAQSWTTPRLFGFPVD